jgi:hypothetical protein
MTSQYLVNFFLFQPVNVALCTALIISAIFFQRNSFFFHVWGVTTLLLVVLHKINLCYGKIQNKFKVYEQIVIAGGVMHAFVPLIGIVIPIAMFVHVGICFMVHVLHLGQSYQVFNDIGMNDSGYLVVLWAVNVMEFAVNLAYCFPHIISNHMFVVFIVVVEMSALLLSSLKLKSVHSSPSPYLQPSPVDTGTVTLGNKVRAIATSRIMVCIVCAGTAGLLLAFNSYNFGIFMTGYAFVLLLNLLHLHEHTVTFHPRAVQVIGPLCPSLLIAIAWLSISHTIPPYIAAILLIIVSLPLHILNLSKLHCIIGFHYSFYVAFFGVLAYFVTLILYGLALHNHRIFEAFMASSILYSMTMMLTDLKVRKGRRVYANGISESKNPSNAVSDLEKGAIGSGLSTVTNGASAASNQHPR